MMRMGHKGLGFGRKGAASLSKGVLDFITKADGSPITKADNSYILKGAT